MASAQLTTLQIPKHLPEPSGCLEPMQGTCPQGVLSQAEMPPALVSVCFKCHLPCLLMSQQARVSIAWLE